jgi:cytochrome b
MVKQRIWDFPIRIFHWSLVVLLGLSWWSAETFRMDWHRYFGFAIGGLIVFRLLWGFIGTQTARFSQFLKGPRAVWRYLRGRTGSAPPGHNPLGGWSVMALLLALTVQVISGLFSVDIDGIESGPLSSMLTFDQGRIAATVHGLSFTVLKMLVILHVAAILFYLLVKKRNLIRAMIVGG